MNCNNQVLSELNRSLYGISSVMILICWLTSIAYGQSQNGNPQTETSSGFQVSSSCHCVAFRLDDIQDYFLDNVQIDIIQTFRNNNASLTVGIIGNYFGDDLHLVAALKDQISNNDNRNNTTHDNADDALEVANHGWNHEDFTQFSKEEQYSLIRDSNRKIFDKLGVTPIVFIPPFNNLNNETLTAAQENGIQYISTNSTTYTPYILGSYANNQSSNQANGSASSNKSAISNLASLAATGDLNPDNTEWLDYSHNDTLGAIQQSVSQLGYAVVTMHPQEYSIRKGLNYTNQADQEQINELQSLLHDVRTAGLKIVTISEIDEQTPAVPEFQSCFVLLSAAILLGPLALYRLKNKKVSV